MSLSILGLGTALPPHTMTQSEARELAAEVCCSDEQQARLLRVLYRRSGVETRRTVVPHRMALDVVDGLDSTGGVATGAGQGPSTAERMRLFQQHAPPLAWAASRAALDDAGTAAADITHLVVVTCTGFVAPGIDACLLRQLGLPPTTERVQVGFMGCHGAINGLRVARGLAAADPQARVLLCAVELCSLHYRFQWDPETFLGNVLFADGAAAIVCGNLASNPDPASDDRRRWQVAATGSCLLPDSDDAMSWRIGDHGFEMSLSARVPDLIAEHLRPWLSQWLARHGTSIEAVGCWAVHPGGPRILTAVEESLQLPPAALQVSRKVLSECGNMSSPTVLFILNRMPPAKARGPCLALGFGPGLVAEAALLI